MILVNWKLLSVELGVFPCASGENDPFPIKKVGHRSETGATYWIAGVPPNEGFYSAIRYSAAVKGYDPFLSCDVAIDQQVLKTMRVRPSWGWAGLPAFERGLTSQHDHIKCSFSPLESVREPVLYVGAVPEYLQGHFDGAVCEHIVLVISKTAFEELYPPGASP